jgi:RND family efflux transporter MFP subunit
MALLQSDRRSARLVRLPRYALLLCALALPLVAACRNSAAAPAAPPPPDVTVTTIAPERVALSSEWIGTLDGYVNAQIRPQVSGYLIKRNYREGSVVKKGQVLFEIDARPFEATLAQANAQLGEAQAQLGKTERDLQRDRPLAEQRAIAQSQFDNDVQANLSAQASVKSAEAAIRTAQLNVGFTKVTSLIDGVAAIATAQIGDLVSPQTLLTTVSQTDPIKSYFSLSEQEYLRIADRLNAGGTGTTQPWKDSAGLTLILADGSTYDKTGHFLAADRQVDPKTGTIRISAVFPNPGNRLRPGQYGRVRAETSVRQDALLVPQRAVAEVQGAYQLRVLSDDNKVNTRPVKLGDRIGSRWIVDEGLKSGERIVVEGPPAKDGTTVNPKPFNPPAVAKAPAQGKAEGK